MATKADIAYHYDVDNDFYGLFLDQTNRAYSCAVWEGASSLEEAQHNKLARLSRFAGVDVGQSVLDIGCGWGGMLKYVIDYAGAATATGVTLSEDQYNFVDQLHHPQINVEFSSWRNYVPTNRFDALISIGAFEHFASLDDRAVGQHRQVYADFFEWCRAVSTNQACLGLQTIVTARAPESLQEVRDTRYLLEHVFPGSALPSVSDIQAGVQDQYEIAEARLIGLDYAHTLAHWRSRLNQCRTEIVSRYNAALYEHYDHYFLAAERSFRAGIVSLVQLSLRPVRPTFTFHR